MKKGHLKRRHFGQHFLRDRHSIEKIIGEAERLIKAAKQEKFDYTNIIEIGPGKGALTRGLIELAKKHRLKLTLVEKDRELVKFWNDEIQTSTQATDQTIDLEILEQDAVEFSLSSAITKALVVSNLPYASGTPILTNLSKFKNITAMVLMFQKEVSDRIASPPDTRDFGSLSLAMQNIYTVTELIKVGPGCFSPPPKVMSSVITLQRRLEPFLTETFDDQEILEKLAKACFLHRRKMLRSALPKDSDYMKALDLAGVNLTKRAEALSWEEWRKAVSCLRELKKHQ